MCSNHTEGVSALPYDVQQTKSRKPQAGIVSCSHDPFIIEGDFRYVGCQTKRGVVTDRATMHRAQMDPLKPSLLGPGDPEIDPEMDPERKRVGGGRLLSSVSVRYTVVLLS